MEIKGNTMGFKVGQKFQQECGIREIVKITERFDRASRSHISIITHMDIETAGTIRTMRGCHTPRELKQFLKKIGATQLKNK